MADRGMRLKLGAFVGGTLLVLAGLVLFFGRAPELFSNKAKYSILFPEAPGIGPGTPVRKSGVRIGEVTDLDLDAETGQVRVHIRVDRKFLPRKSEEAIITKALFSGDVAIDFVPRIDEKTSQPVPREEDWPPDSEIPGVPPITPRSLLTPASGILADAQRSLDRVARAFEGLEKTQPKLDRALDEASETFKAVRTLVPEAKKTMEGIRNFLGADAPIGGPGAGGVMPAGGIALLQPVEQPNMRALIRDVQDLARSVRPAVDDLRAMMRRLEPEVTGTFKAARQTFENVNDILSPENRKQVTELLKNANSVAVSVVKISNALTTMLDGAEKTIKNLDSLITQAGGVVGDVRAVTKPLAAKSEAIVGSVLDTTDQLNKTLTEVRTLLATFGKGNGSIQKLLTDPAVYQNIDDAAGSLARVMARAEKITRDLEVFADKIARRPEIIGIGGAIRPSSGLKDLPGTALPAYRPEWPPATNAPRSPASGGPNWLPPSGGAGAGGPPPPVQGYPPR